MKRIVVVAVIVGLMVGAFSVLGYGYVGFQAFDMPQYAVELLEANGTKAAWFLPGPRKTSSGSGYGSTFYLN